jgi:hypothetical protein
MERGNAIHCRIVCQLEEEEKEKERKHHLSSVFSSNFSQALLRRWHNIRLKSENIVHEFVGESSGICKRDREREKERERDREREGKRNKKKKKKKKKSE